MTPAEFKRARETLCLSQNDLAEVWGMGDNGGRTIRRWECGERPLNPIAAYCLQLMLGEKEWPRHAPRTMQLTTEPPR